MNDTGAGDLALAAEFPSATREQWRKLVEQVLKGTSFESLVSESYDGLRIEPLSAWKGQATPIIGRSPGSRWHILQRLDHPRPAAANAEAKEDIANGATGLLIEFTGASGAYGWGIAFAEEALAELLDGIHLDSGIAIDLDAGARAADTADTMAALLQRRGTAPGAAAVRFGLDPIGAMAFSGGAVRSWSDVAGDFGRTITHLAHYGYHGPFAVADGRIVHNAGGSEAQELAYVLATGVAYLRALASAGVALDAASRMIYFRLSADAEQFLTISKFRALRKLWARIEQACGIAPGRAFITAETAWRTMTKRDPYVNMLRAAIAVLAAGLGGADAITVLPFTLALGLPDRFARRIARNTQLVLLEESNLARVADPAAGAAAIEDLTDQLCHAAWKRFQEIEKAGGVLMALQEGQFQAQVAAMLNRRRSALATRREALVGTTDFADPAESALEVEKAESTYGRVHEGETSFRALAPVRLAEPFEELRDLSDEILARTGARPKLFLGNIGRASDFGARAAFCKNLFGAGGIEAQSNDGFNNRAEMIAAYERSGTKLACLCSSDELYAREGTTAVEALLNAGASVWVAGRPAMLEAFQRAGICGCIFAGCDVLATLRKAYEIIR
jgi:methylmalonyl-CoA mutase